MNRGFAIPNPCPKKWDELTGEGRQRHCDRCGKSVHAMDQYSREEWNQLWCESNGQVCGFMAPSPVAEPHSRRAILVGALLTAIAPLMAETGQVRIRVLDATGAVIPGAKVSLPDNLSRTENSNRLGEVLLSDLPLGDLRLTASSPGFMSRSLTATIRSSAEQKIDVTLQIAAGGTVGVIVEVVPADIRKK